MRSPITVDLGPDPSDQNIGVRRLGLRWTEAGSGLDLQCHLFSPVEPDHETLTHVYVTTATGEVYRLTRDAVIVSLNASLEFGRPTSAMIDSYDRHVVIGEPFGFSDPEGRCHTSATVTSIVAADSRLHPADEVRSRSGGVSDRVPYSMETELRGLTGAPQRALLAVGRRLRSGRGTPHAAAA